MTSMLKKFFAELRLFFKGVGRALLESSVQVLEAEYLELENAFLTMLLGSLVGIKTMPSLIALEVLATVRDEVKVLLTRGYKGEDVFADLFGVLGPS